MSTPVSGSSYIIICNGRIEVALARHEDDLIRAASNCTSQFACYMGLRYYRGDDDVTPKLQPLSAIQHQLMDHVTGVRHLTKAELDSRIAEAFRLMDEIEGQYTSS